jgi:hypothetical protein
MESRAEQFALGFTSPAPHGFNSVEAGGLFFSSLPHYLFKA